MLVTQQKILRRFWYPVLPAENLGDAPVGVRLLGEDLALWRGPDGAPAVVQDRCCHRSAKLSRGWAVDGNVVCPYHGWAYATDGRCVRVPQAKVPERDNRYAVPAYSAQVRYDQIWVCLDAAPLAGIPEVPEYGAEGWRVIPEFFEPWGAPGLRIMENSFDNAHFSYVHARSFGVIEEPEPAPLSLIDTDQGFIMLTEVPVKNPEQQQKNLGIAEERTIRKVEKTWWMPFSRKMKITYPNGRVHILLTLTAPIDDRSSQVTQIAIRNDSEAEAPAAGVIAFDRQVTHEDRGILEMTDCDVPLDLRRERHMPSDRPGMEMRKRLAALLAEHGEPEMTAAGPVPVSWRHAAE